MVFFYKQKTAYALRISDWSSDVCSSDLSFNMGPGVRADHTPADETEASLFSANRWPAALPELKAVWESHYAQMLTLAERLMSIFAQIGRASCRERVCQYV